MKYEKKKKERVIFKSNSNNVISTLFTQKLANKLKKKLNEHSVLYI